ncbi:MAG: DNA-binding response regulator, LuxR family [Ignavibacteriae bacterium]|nr:MAG: DNA-binding response regulator, LuxR family [Ignavibacteriota bacterium]
MAKKIFIVDDHPIVRQGLIKIIEDMDGFELVGESGDGVEALKLCEQLKPDIIVVDISLPSMNGFELIRNLNEKTFKKDYIVMTMYKEEEYFDEAIELDVKGYILKESAGINFKKCLQEVSLGKYYFSSEFSDNLAKRTHATSELLNKKPSLKLLTPMELKILKLISENKTSKEIGEELHISHRTVQNHRAHICEKLGIEGYNTLLQFAIEHKHML